MIAAATATTTATSGLAVENAVGVLAGCRADCLLRVSGTCRCHDCRCRGRAVEGHEHAATVGLVSDLLAEQPAEDLLESAAKFSREHGVDERVDGGVAVAQPEDGGEDERRNAVLAEGRDQVHGEEGKPADDEAADDDAQSFGRLRLHSESPDLVLDVPPPEGLVVLGGGGCLNAAGRYGQVGRVVDHAADHGRDAAHASELVGGSRQGEVQQRRRLEVDPTGAAADGA